MAHPDEIRHRLPDFPPYPWTDWSVEGYTGIEIWNQMSEWMEKLTAGNKILMAFSPRKSMVGPTDRILQKWDEISKQRKCVGVVGVDAHAFPIKVGPFRFEIFPYKVHFKTLRTHIILPEPMSSELGKAREQLYDALRECRVFGSNMRWGIADDFQFYAENGSHRVPSGGELRLTANTRIVIKSPSRATLRLIHDGKLVLSAHAKELVTPVKSSGLYRVEAWKGRRGWVFSNHIRIAAS